MNKTSENGKKPNFRTDFGTNLFHGFYLYQMLGTAASYHRIQFQGKLMIQTQENDEKPHFGSDIGLLDPVWGAKIF